MHPPSRARWIAAAALTSITLLAACSGGSGSKRATAPATTSATDATQSSTTIAPITHAVNHTVYYAGFRLGMSVATLRSTDAGNRVLDIATTFSNDGTDPGAFEAGVDLASAGKHYRLDQVATNLPNVSGQAQASGNLTFDVDDKFVLNDAVLTIGPPSHAQVVLPLGAAGALADLAPATFALSGTASTGPLRLDVKSGLLRADNPKDHLQSAKGHRFLSINFDVTNTSSFAAGYVFTHDNMALKLSDGTQLAPDDGPIELLKPDSTLKGQTARFTVPAPGAAGYQVLLIDDISSPHTTSAIAITVAAGA